MGKLAQRIIRKTEVLDLVGLSDTTLWRLEKTNDFPKRLRLGGNSVGWHEGEVLAWIKNRPRCAEEAEESAI